MCIRDRIGAAVMLGLGRECLVLRWLHIPCLTCGMTRSLRALLQLDWRRSLHYHPLTVPFLIGFWLLFPVSYTHLLYQNR